MSKTNEQLLLNYNYFQLLPSAVDLNIENNFYMQLWTLKFTKDLLFKQYNQYLFTEIMKYLDRIEPMFKSILCDLT